MTHIRIYRDEQIGPHVRLRVFAGPDAEHLALTGTLTMHELEAAHFAGALIRGRYAVHTDPWGAQLRPVESLDIDLRDGGEPGEFISGSMYLEDADPAGPVRGLGKEPGR